MRTLLITAATILSVHAMDGFKDDWVDTRGDDR